MSVSEVTPQAIYELIKNKHEKKREIMLCKILPKKFQILCLIKNVCSVQSSNLAYEVDVSGV